GRATRSKPPSQFAAAFGHRDNHPGGFRVDLHSIVFFARALYCQGLVRGAETTYLISDNFGGDETDELRSAAHRNAAAQKRTAAATRNRSDMTGKYGRASGSHS